MRHATFLRHLGLSSLFVIGLALLAPSPAAAEPTEASTTWQQVSAGAYHTCGLDADGRVRCWGLGTDPKTDEGRQDYDQAVAPGGNFEAISAGNFHTCGLRTDGTVACWGSGADSGSGTGNPISPPPGPFQTVEAGSAVSCGLRDGEKQGQLECWGRDYLVDALMKDIPEDTTFEELSVGGIGLCVLDAKGRATCSKTFGGDDVSAPEGRFIDISFGGYHACGVRPDHSVDCWGLGDDPKKKEADIDVGQAVPPSSGSFVDVAAGYLHTCGLRDDGQTVCWGAGVAGAPDESPEGRFHVGQADPPDTPFVGLTAGYWHTCGRTDAGDIACWGVGTTPEVDEAERAGFFDFDQARRMTGGADALAAGRHHTCVAQPRGSNTCIGRNDSGQADIPKAPFQQLVAGAHHTCGLRDDGEVRCWGAGTDPEADEGRHDHDQSVVPDGTTFTFLAAHGYSTCGLQSDGELTCWGREFQRGSPPDRKFETVAISRGFQCGVPADTSEDAYCWSSPGRTDRVSGPTGRFETLSVSSTHGCGVRADGHIDCWGLGSKPEVEEDTLWRTVDADQAVPPEGEFQAVATGAEHSCGLTTTGSAVCWGSDRMGQATPPEGKFEAIVAGAHHTCGRRPDGTVDCWGVGTDKAVEGVRLDFDQASPPSPGAPASPEVAIEPGAPGRASNDDAALGERAFQSIAVGESTSCGVRRNGAVECWGHLEELVKPLRSEDPTPVDVAVGDDHICVAYDNGEVRCRGPESQGIADPPPGNFVAVDAGRAHTCARGDDGSVMCWGAGSEPNSDGRAADGSGQYLQVSAGYTQTCAVTQDRQIECWGRDTEAPSGRFVQVASGDDLACGLRPDGTVSCRGQNDHGQAAPPGLRFRRIDVEEEAGCGILPDGSLRCWGGREIPARIKPLFPPPDGQFRALAVADTHACAIEENGAVRCWGHDTDGSTHPPRPLSPEPREARKLADIEVRSSKLADEPRLAVIPEGTAIYARASKGSSHWKADQTYALPAEDVGDGWMHITAGTEMPNDTDVCHERLHPRWDVHFFVPKKHLPSVLTEATTVEFDDGTAASFPPGAIVSPNGDVHLQDFRIPASMGDDISRKHVAKTFPPQSIAVPDAPERARYRGEREPRTVMITRLTMGGDSVTDLQTHKSLEPGASDSEATPNAGDSHEQIDRQVDVGATTLLAERDRDAYLARRRLDISRIFAHGDGRVLVRVHAGCGVVEAVAPRRAIDRFRDVSPSVVAFASQKDDRDARRIPSGTPLFWPDGTRAGQLREASLLAGPVDAKTRRANDKKLVCFRPGAYRGARVVEPADEMALCIQASELDDV